MTTSPCPNHPLKSPIDGRPTYRQPRSFPHTTVCQIPHCRADLALLPLCPEKEKEKV